jgi:hypothetical protein
LDLVKGQLMFLSMSISYTNLQVSRVSRVVCAVEKELSYRSNGRMVIYLEAEHLVELTAAFGCLQDSFTLSKGR